MKFEPKKDFVYAVVIWMAPVFVLPIFFVLHTTAVLIILVVTFLLSYWMWNSTEYKIEDDELHIKCWVFKQKVKVKDIDYIKRTKNIYSSFALSVERLEVKKYKGVPFYIAPLKQEEFIKAVKKINENIAVA